MELALSAFVVGLASGAHCVAMCGGVLGALNLRPPQRVIPIARDGTAAWSGDAASLGRSLGLQLSYNGGRIASYATAGSLAGAATSAAAVSSAAAAVQSALGLFANVLLVVLGLHIAGVGRLLPRLEALAKPLWRRIAPLSRRFMPADTPVRALGLGALWGWLPCGLVYSVLGMAFMSASPVEGATVMAAFGFGTLPNLLAAGFAFERLQPWLGRVAIRRTAGGLIAALGFWGIARLPQTASWVTSALDCFA